jgi:DNA-binding winged helix-turn-helix (wHTH) protein/TolB-like protein/Tfp pilus assembly protein PilF
LNAQTFATGTSARPRLSIGEWLADPATNELRRDGRKVRIEPKAMDVLMLLAARSGDVVHREELFAAVWPGVVVGDEALTQCMIKLRRALGDNPRSPSYIETISKRGYRLIAPVAQREAVANLGGVVDRASAQPAPGRIRLVSGAVAGVLLALVVAAGIYLFPSIPHSTRNTEAVGAADEGPSPSITLTVMPFETLGAEGEASYLARGIGNDLMTELSRLPGLRLIRASSTGTRSAGRGYLVSGSVQRVSETLRINIHLVDTETNQQLWSERFERPFGDLFAVQDEIIRRLTELLPGKISDAARQRTAKRYTRSLEAYDYFLRGQALLLVRQAEENEEARGHYRKALELDPKFARAYAGLGMTYAMEANLQRRADSPAALARALELAETARQIDPDIPEVHWALGLVHTQSRRHEQALQSLKQAIDLNRSYADAYALMAGIHAYVGQPAKSIPLLRTAMRLNPDGGYLYYLILGRAYLFENDVEQALINLREASTRNPVNLETRVYLAAGNVAAGDRVAAEWEVDEIRALEPGFALQGWLEIHPLTSARHRQRLVELLAKAGLQ